MKQGQCVLWTWGAILVMAGLAISGLASGQEAVAEEAAKEKPEESEGPWKVIEVGDHDYVDAEGMKAFYGFDRFEKQENAVTIQNKKIIVQLTVGSRDCLINGVRFLASRPVLLQGGTVLVSRMDLAKLFDPILRPDHARNAENFRIVVLDPVKGGEDKGIMNELGNEADYAYEIAERARKKLESQGYHVVMTRTKDNSPPSTERAALIREVKDNAIVISIGFSGDEAVNGIRTRVLAPVGVPGLGQAEDIVYPEKPGNRWDSANMALAASMQGVVTRRLGKNSPDLGVTGSREELLQEASHPAVLVECGSMNHPYEKRVIATQAFHTAMGEGIAEAVNRYREAVRKEPKGQR